MPNLDKAYQWAIDTCNAPKIGYSQDHRNQDVVSGITYYDCSSFIWYSLLKGGFDVETAYKTATNLRYTGNAITTRDERSWLLALGFNQIPITGEWKKGDILWRSGHTEMVYTGGVGRGVTMGAHTRKVPLADQVSINSSESTYSSWTSLYRFGSGGASTYGYSIYVISALCGNAWRESHINPSFNEIGGTGFGIFQWSFGRKTNLLNWLDANGYSSDNPIGQLEFLLYENDWIKNYGEYNTLQEFLNSSSTDIPYLTECFTRCWERPGVVALEERIEFAQKAYEYIQSHANDTSIKEWHQRDDYLTEKEALNNAVMMYRFFSSGGGGGGTTTKRKQMPVWMMLRRF